MNLTRKAILFLFFAVPLLIPSLYITANAAEPALLPGSRALLDKYGRIEERLAKNQFGLPIFVESEQTDNSLRVDVYGVLDYPFAGVRDALRMPENWCDIVSLHINVKACTYKKPDKGWLLTVYSGRKFYQSPDDAQQLQYRYGIPAQEPDYVRILLDAAKGPLGTKTHRLELEAAPLHGDRSFIHLSYGYAYGAMGRFAMKSYFATMGSGKVGFSVVSRDEHGNPVYVDGVKGAIERNAVRYYFAIGAYLDALKSPPEARFERRTSRWYELTERFPRQLHEMDRESYLDDKRRERKNQLILQAE